MLFTRWLGAGYLIAAAVLGIAVFAGPASSRLLPSNTSVSLLTEADIRIDGAAADDLAGTSVAEAGDVNGDGRGDVIVGAPGADNNGRAESGSAYVLFGPFGPTVDLAALGAGGFRIDGAVAGDFAGISVSKAGDINGDGLDDLLLGAVDIAMTDPGKAYVVFGKSSSTPVDLASLGTAGFSMVGNGSDRAGAAVAGGEDVNRDGVPDLAVAAPFAGNSGRNDSGSVYVVYGPVAPGTLNLQSLGSGGFRIDGPDENEFLGETGIALGDVSGDRRADVMAGTRISSNNARGTSGSAYAIFGKGSPDLVDTAALGAAGFRVDGAAAGDQAGTSVGTLEDANGDTRAELVVGSPRADANGRAESGSVHIVFGKSSSDTVDLATLGSAGRRIDGPAAAGMYATSSAGAGDVNRDGRGELLAGAPVIGGGAGAAYLTLGRATTSVVLAGAGTKTWTLAGAAADDAVGETESVASAGDVDGDGRDDVIVAARKADSNGRGDSGSAYILLGPSPLAGRCANPLLGTSTKDRLNGTKAGDRIKGLAKKDRLKGKSGKDCLIGGGGNDFLKGGKGKDRHKGGAGNDLIDSRDGRRGDRINCGAGKRDRVKADRGDRVARNCERVRRA